MSVSPVRTARFLLCLWALLLSGCASLINFEDPTVELLKIQPLAKSEQGPRFEIVLRVVNPNADALTIDGLFYELDVAGSTLMTGASNESSTIPAYGEGVVKVEAEVSVFKLMRLFGGIMLGGDKPELDYELDLKIDVAQLPLPLRISKEGRLDEDFLKGAR